MKVPLHRPYQMSIISITKEMCKDIVALLFTLHTFLFCHCSVFESFLVDWESISLQINYFHDTFLAFHIKHLNFTNIKLAACSIIGCILLEQCRVAFCWFFPPAYITLSFKLLLHGKISYAKTHPKTYFLFKVRVGARFRTGQQCFCTAARAFIFSLIYTRCNAALT